MQLQPTVFVQLQPTVFVVGRSRLTLQLIRTLGSLTKKPVGMAAQAATTKMAPHRRTDRRCETTYSKHQSKTTPWRNLRARISLRPPNSAKLVQRFANVHQPWAERSLTKFGQIRPKCWSNLAYMLAQRDRIGRASWTSYSMIAPGSHVRVMLEESWSVCFGAGASYFSELRQPASALYRPRGPPARNALDRPPARPPTDRPSGRLTARQPDRSTRPTCRPTDRPSVKPPARPPS